MLRVSVQSDLLQLPSIIQTHKFPVNARFIVTEICWATLFIVGRDEGRNPTGPTCILLLFEIICDPLIFFFFFYLSDHINLVIAMRAVWIFFTVCFTASQRRFLFYPTMQTAFVETQSLCQQMSHLCSAQDKTSYEMIY